MPLVSLSFVHPKLFGIISYDDIFIKNIASGLTFLKAC